MLRLLTWLLTVISIKVCRKRCYDTLRHTLRHTFFSTFIGVSSVLCRCVDLFSIDRFKKKYIKCKKSKGYIEKRHKPTQFCIFDGMIVIGIQIPYAMMVGWELFLDKKHLNYKSFVLHLLVLTIEFIWDGEPSE